MDVNLGIKNQSVPKLAMEEDTEKTVAQHVETVLSLNSAIP